VWYEPAATFTAFIERQIAETEVLQRVQSKPYTVPVEEILRLSRANRFKALLALGASLFHVSNVGLGGMEEGVRSATLVHFAKVDKVLDSLRPLSVLELRVFAYRVFGFVSVFLRNTPREGREQRWDTVRDLFRRVVKRVAPYLGAVAALDACFPSGPAVWRWKQEGGPDYSLWASMNNAAYPGEFMDPGGSMPRSISHDDGERWERELRVLREETAFATAVLLEGAGPPGRPVGRHVAQLMATFLLPSLPYRARPLPQLEELNAKEEKERLAAMASDKQRKTWQAEQSRAAGRLAQEEKERMEDMEEVARNVERTRRALRRQRLTTFLDALAAQPDAQEMIDYFLAFTECASVQQFLQRLLEDGHDAARKIAVGDHRPPPARSASLWPRLDSERLRLFGGEDIAMERKLQFTYEMCYAFQATVFNLLIRPTHARLQERKREHEVRRVHHAQMQSLEERMNAFSMTRRTAREAPEDTDARMVPFSGAAAASSTTTRSYRPRPVDDDDDWASDAKKSRGGSSSAAGGSAAAAASFFGQASSSSNAPIQWRDVSPTFSAHAQRAVDETTFLEELTGKYIPVWRMEAYQLFLSTPRNRNPYDFFVTSIASLSMTVLNALPTLTPWAQFLALANMLDRVTLLSLQPRRPNYTGAVSDQKMELVVVGRLLRMLPRLDRLQLRVLVYLLYRSLESSGMIGGGALLPDPLVRAQADQINHQRLRVVMRLILSRVSLAVALDDVLDVCVLGKDQFMRWAYDNTAFWEGGDRMLRWLHHDIDAKWNTAMAPMQQEIRDLRAQMRDDQDVVMQ